MLAEWEIERGIEREKALKLKVYILPFAIFLILTISED